MFSPPFTSTTSQSSAACSRNTINASELCYRWSSKTVYTSAAQNAKQSLRTTNFLTYSWKWPGSVYPKTKGNMSRSSRYPIISLTFEYFWLSFVFLEVYERFFRLLPRSPFYGAKKAKYRIVVTNLVANSTNLTSYFVPHS